MTAKVSAYDIGDTVYAVIADGTALNAETQISGGNLRTVTGLQFWELSSSAITFPVTSGVALPGTWRSPCKVDAAADDGTGTSHTVVWAAPFIRES